MAKTDGPLKRLITSFIEDFAAWLLNTNITDAESRNIELPPDPDPIKSDQVFHITLADGKTVLLHIEFQGPSSHKPMPLRMLDYMARLQQTYRDIEMHNVVFYVGYGAGKNDKGYYQVERPDGKTALVWQYDVIHLWNKPAEELLALGKPALLPLIGQMKITKPEMLLPKVVEQLKTVTDPEQQKRLFTELMALINDEEMIKMLEKMIEEEGLLMDTPFLRRIRNEGRQEGWQEGRQEGRQEAWQEAELTTFKKNILNLLALRLNPPALVYQPIIDDIETINDKALLKDLFATAAKIEDVEQFKQVLQDKLDTIKAKKATDEEVSDDKSPILEKDED